MNKLLIFTIFSLSSLPSFAQTCTVTGTSPLNWPTNGSTVACSEGGFSVGKTTLIIPAGFTVVFNDNGDTWIGTKIEVYGTLNIAASPTLNTSIVVKSGGRMNITGSLALGSSGPGCGYTLAVGPGGIVDVGGTGSDRLTICGVELMKGSGACNSCGGTNSGACAYNGQPYCEPSGGFTGPTGFDEGGYNASLPVKLLYFLAAVDKQTVKLNWATSMEENFYKFVVQRSFNGLSFEDIGEVQGKGFNIYNTETEYDFVDDAPKLGYNYYRLKAVDLDEAYEYFGLKAVKMTGSKQLGVYPNPSSGQLISFRTNFSPQESDRITLTDQLGAEIYNARASTLNNSISLQNQLSPGIYLLRYISEGFQQTARIIIRN